MIYLDNAATSVPKPQAVAQAITAALNTFGNPARGAHGFSLAAARCVEEARAEVAALFGCADAGRTVFTKNATEALNITISSLQGHVVTTAAEHNSVLRPLYRRGNFSVVKMDGKGRVRAEDIAAAVSKTGAKAVVMTAASNVTGNPMPVAEVGEFCRQHDMLFALDASQTAGLVQTDMEALGVDALCCPGHKSLYGPQGTGVLCLSARFLPQPLAVGGSGSHSFSETMPPETPDRLEAGTVNSHGIAGLLAGIRYAQSLGVSALEKPLALVALLRRRVASIPGIEFYGDPEMAGRVPILALNLPGYSSGEVADLLDGDYGIAVRSGAHCAPLVHRHFGTEKRGMVRFSPSHFTTEDEMEQTAKALWNMYKERANG